jgi:PAS domain S-box-containing protein
MAEWLGSETVSYVGKKCREVFHALGIDNPPEGCPFSSAIAARKPWSGEIPMRNADVWCIASCSPLYDAEGQITFILHTMTDISKQKQAELALRERETRLTSILEGANVASWEWNIQTGNLTLSPNMYTLLGMDPQQADIRTLDDWMELKHPSDALDTKSQLERHLRGETDFYSFESRMRHADGSWVWTLGRGKVTEWDKDGKPLRMFGTHMDISERKHADESIRRLLAEKELILKEVHHRIKNNLNSVISLLSLQANAQKDSAIKEILLDASGRIRSMMVLYDRLYRSKSVGEIAIKDYLLALVDELTRSHPQEVAIETQVKDISLDVKTVSVLGIIINELITNTLKYAFLGRTDGSIKLSASKQGDRLVLLYEDDGNGIPDSITLGNSPGFGLQLVGMLVEQLQGTIVLERGCGTKFRIEI